MKLYRFPERGVDVAVSTFRRRTNIHVFHHGVLADKPLWVRVEVNGRLWDVDSRELGELFRRQPKAKLVQEPLPWAVIAENADA